MWLQVEALLPSSMKHLSIAAHDEHSLLLSPVQISKFLAQSLQRAAAQLTELGIA